MIRCSFGGIAGAARQRFQILLQYDDRPAFLVKVFAERPARHELVIDVKLAVTHLDVVARQPDDALYVIDRRIGRQLEDGDVAALRPLRKRQVNPPGEQRQPERQRIPAVAVGEFRHEQVIADQQGRHHRAGRYVERLVGDGADHDRYQDGIDDRLDGLEKAARRLFCGSHFGFGFHHQKAALGARRSSPPRPGVSSSALSRRAGYRRRPAPRPKALMTTIAARAAVIGQAEVEARGHAGRG